MFDKVRKVIAIVLSVLVVFCSAGDLFKPHVAVAAGAQQIRDAKLKWVTTDYDGIPERLLLKKEYDNGDTFSVQPDGHRADRRGDT